MGIKIMITGATGLVGEGVLLASLAHPEVKEVLMINRKHLNREHPKLKELIIPDFLKLDAYTEQLMGYDACFYCAGISSVGMNEAKYSYITYDTTLHFATKLASLNPNMVFNYVSGSHTDGSEKGKIMWARIKGKTENVLKTLPFKSQYNFRPGAMKPDPEQKNAKMLYQIIVGIISVILPNQVCTLHEVALAMINTTIKGYPSQILEIKDIKELAKT